MANRQRAKEKLEKLQQEISQIAKRTGIAVDNKLTIIQPKKFFVSFFVRRIVLLIKFRLVGVGRSRHRMVGCGDSSAAKVRENFFDRNFVIRGNSFVLVTQVFIQINTHYLR